MSQELKLAFYKITVSRRQKMKGTNAKILLTAIGLILIVAILALAGACSSSTPASSTSASPATSAPPTSAPPASPTSSAGKVLKIGMILPATGAAAEKGKPGG